MTQYWQDNPKDAPDHYMGEKTLSEEIIVGFVVDFDRLEALPETPDQKFRIIETQEGLVVHLGLWY